VRAILAGTRIVAVAVCVGSCGMVGSSSNESAGSSWDAARTSSAGRSVVLVFTGGPDYDPADPCSSNYRVRVDERDDRVVLGLVTIKPDVDRSADVDDVGCVALGYPRTITAQLDAPLGTRTVIDSFRDAVRPVFDGTRLLQPRMLPEGWVLRSEGVAYPTADTSQVWSQGWGLPTNDSDMCSPGFGVIQGSPQAVEALPVEMGGQTMVGTFDINGATAAQTATPERQTERLTWTIGDTAVAVIARTCAEPLDLDLMLSFARSIE
jgi:hypothetical protein